MFFLFELLDFSFKLPTKPYRQTLYSRFQNVHDIIKNEKKGKEQMWWTKVLEFFPGALIQTKKVCALCRRRLILRVVPGMALIRDGMSYFVKRDINRKRFL